MHEALKRLLLVVGAQVPVAGVALVQWSKIQEYPVAAVLLAVLWEIGAVALAFLIDVWVELRKDALQATVDWIRAAVRGFAPGFRHSYNRWLVREYSIFNVRGLGLIQTFTLSLKDVFVDLKVSPANPQKINFDPLKSGVTKDNRTLWDFLRDVIASDSENCPAVLTILGPPGCGKTTLLQLVAVTLAANQQRKFRLRAYTPILLFLREHITELLQMPPSRLGKLAQNYIKRKKPLGKEPPEEWFERQLLSGRCIVLLDGLDEVANLEQRQVISKWVDEQIVNYPGCPFLITSRPQGYRSAPLQRANVLEVQPFNANQMRQFIERWYLASETKNSSELPEQEIRNKADAQARDLIQRLQRTPSMNALTVNPLLLTMVTTVHCNHDLLPGSRLELYKEICEVLLNRWRKTQGIHDNLKTSQKLAVLQPLAAYMMEKERRDIDDEDEDVAKVISAPLERMKTANVTPRDFLERLRDSSGLVQEREAGKWCFAHPTFQEYLAANHWLEQKGQYNFEELVTKSWWQEMLRHYAAQANATELVKSCLKVGGVEALTLAADCLEEAREIDKEVRYEAEERIIADLESDDPVRQRLAAEVELSRRLRSLQRIDNARSIDLKHLSCAEYQLFLDDMSAQGKYWHPDHWLETRFTKGMGREPICGLRAEDAMKFCEWLTRRQGFSARYRLPRPDELQAYPGENGQMGTWCHDGQEVVLDCPDDTCKSEMVQVLQWQKMSGNFRALAHALDLARTRARTLTITRVLDLVRGLEIARALDRALDFNLARDTARALARAENDLIELNEMSLHETQERIRDIMSSAQGIKIHQAGIWDALLSIANAKTIWDFRKSQRLFLDRIFKCVLEVDDESPTFFEQIRSWFGEKSKSSNKIELQKFYMGLQLIMARENGKSKAWEGIRIVREEIQKDAQGESRNLNPPFGNHVA